MGLGPPGNAKVGKADVFGTLTQNQIASFWFDLPSAFPYGSTGGIGEIILGGIVSGSLGL
jgi:hypothetical protein